MRHLRPPRANEPVRRDAGKLTDPFLPTCRQQASGKWRQEWRQARRNAAFNPTPKRAPNPNPNPKTQNRKDERKYRRVYRLDGT